MSSCTRMQQWNLISLCLSEFVVWLPVSLCITCALSLLGKGDPSLQGEAEKNGSKMYCFALKGANGWLNLKYYKKLHRLFLGYLDYVLLF